MSYEYTSRTDEELQRAMHLIIDLLGMLKRCRRDLRQSSRIEKEISTAVTRLEFLIGEYECLATATDAQKPDGEYQLGSRFVCPECRPQKMKSESARQAVQATGVEIPFIWQPSLQFALSCTRLVADEYFSDRDMGGNFPSCLVQLRAVLRGLQQLLPASATAETKLSVADFSSACAKCGKSLEVVP